MPRHLMHSLAATAVLATRLLAAYPYLDHASDFATPFDKNNIQARGQVETDSSVGEDPQLIERVGLVTEMSEITHYCRRGIPGRVGIQTRAIQGWSQRTCSSWGTWSRSSTRPTTKSTKSATVCGWR